MAIEVIVPRQGWSMEEGTFGGWLKQEGERIQPGDALFLLETDKATEEIEAMDGGILRISADAPKAGDTVKVGQVLGYLAAEGETVARRDEETRRPGDVAARETKVQTEPPPAGPAARRLARSMGVDLAQVAGSGSGGRIVAEDIRRQGSPANGGRVAKPAASPRARRVAKELGIDWSQLQGSGRTGRIRERDVRAAAGGASGGRLIPHTRIRRTIAARMVAGVTQAAPVTLTTKADAENLVNLRQQFKVAAGDIVPAYTDMLVKLTAAALKQHPLLQAQWRDEGLFVPDRIDIAVAVDTEAGLLVPVVRDADKHSLREVATDTNKLAEQARAGQLSAAQMRDATFTITNLGAYGIDAFTPIIHLPQCAVLGVGRIVREPAVMNDQIVPRHMLTLSLTFDHRIVDGAPAARFLNTLRRAVENPAPWLIT